MNFFDEKIKEGANITPSIPPQKNNRKKTQKTNNRRDLIFCIGMMAYPIIQWLIFYVGFNFDSILLAFQKYNPAPDGGMGTFTFYPINDIFHNFKLVLNDLFGATGVGKYVKTSAIWYSLTWVIGFVVSHTFAFLIYKKCPGSEIFKTLLYLPSIISSVVLCFIYRYFIETVLPGVFPGQFPTDSPFIDDRGYGWVLGYAIFMSMPGGIVVNTSTMARIPKELIESGQLDGLTLMGEMYHIVLPLIFPVMEMGMLGMFLGIFTYSGPILAFYGLGGSVPPPESIKTVGYYLFNQVLQSGNVGYRAYSYSAATGLMTATFSIPIVYGTKWLLDKFDPNAEF